MRVLVVEDFEPMARAIGTGLRREGMAVDVVLDGTDALEHLAMIRYDVVVLDRDLPGVHGDEICRRLAPRTPPFGWIETRYGAMFPPVMPNTIGP